jgi:integrase
MACVRKRRGRWVVDFRDHNGKRHWETYDTKKEADDRLADRTIEVREHTYIDAGELPTFAAVAQGWLTIKRDHPASTFNFWRSHVELHLVPAFGERRIDQVLAADIERFRNAKRDGTDGHTQLARATINQLLQTLTAILDYAVAHKYLRSNPGSAVKRVRAERRTGVTDNVEVDPKEVLTAEQAGQVIGAATPGLYRTFIMMGLLTGCRSGELLALAWEHVDLDAATVKISRSLSRARSEVRGYGKSVPVFGPTKTPSSNRTLDLAPELVHALKVWRLQSRYKGDEDLVFTNSLGGPLHRAFLHKGLRRALDQCAGVPRVNLHGLRHSFASILIQRGHAVSEVAQILGHKSPELTLKVYTHWFKGLSSAKTMADLAGAICAPRPATGSNLVATDETAGAAAAK